MGLKVDTVQNPTSSTVNLTLNTAGGVAVGKALSVGGSVSAPIPVVKAISYSMVDTDFSIIFSGGGTITFTLQAASSYPGRILYVKTTTAFSVVSPTANVVPLAGGAASTAILPATAGKWAMLQSNGSSWVIMAAN